MNLGYHSHRGLDFARMAVAMMFARANPGPGVAANFAAKRWGRTSNVVAELQSVVTKAAVGGLETTDNGGSLSLSAAGAEFLEVAHSLSIVGRLQGLRRVPSNVPIVLQPGTATAYWVGESKAIPMSRNAFTRTSLRCKMVGALTVFSKELAESGSDAAVITIRDDLLEAAVRVLDLAFIDPSNLGDSDTPASITSGLTTYQSTGDLADDVELALLHFTGSLMNASWIMSARLAAQAGIRAGGKGLAADLGARGGQLAGLPVITSESVPGTSDGAMLALVDAGAITVVEKAPEVSSTDEATIEMTDAPAGASDTPTAMASHAVSLWQTESVATKVTLHANWVRARDGSVVVIDDASYTAP